MTEFKLLGGTDPAAQSLGMMLQGIGFPLHPVEPAVSGGAVTVKTEVAMQASSFVDQDPTGLGAALQLTLGTPQTTTYFDVDAAGLITCLVADEYMLRLKVTTGREGVAGESQIYVRIMLNGVQFGNSSHTIIDDPRIEIPATYEGSSFLDAGDTITVEIIRDTDGSDSGGVRAGIPDVVGWNPSPSVSTTFTRTFALVTVP